MRVVGPNRGHSEIELDPVLAYRRARALDAMLRSALPPMFLSHARQLGELAAKARLPLVGIRRALTDAGGLLSYDSDLKR